MTSTSSPALNRSPIDTVWPTSKSSTLVDAELADRASDWAALGRSLSWPASGLVSFLRGLGAELDGRIAVALASCAGA